jgi:hypothetical protein
MGAPRTWASGLLGFVLRHAPAHCRDWAGAMLRELDFIHNDWAALLWAFGSATAILQCSGRGWFGRLKKRLGFEEGMKMDNFWKKTVGVLAGFGIATLLVLCSFGLMRVLALLFPELGLEHTPWMHLLTAIVIPEIAFVIAAILLWRKRRLLATGILTFGILAMVHVAVHHITHMGGH